MSDNCTTCHGSFRLLVRHLREVSELTDAQWRMLRSAAERGNPYHHIRGRAAHGGAVATRNKLVRLGLLDVNGITEAGRSALENRKAKR